MSDTPTSTPAAGSGHSRVHAAQPAEALAPCVDCPFAPLQAVASRGPVPAAVLFLSGAPRYHEEHDAVAFASPSRGVLDTMLADAGLDPGTVHFATLTACRPPYQRPLRTEEAAACAPRLEILIGALAPRIIVVCGPEALGLVLPGLTLSVAHGTLVRRGRHDYYPLRHPYAALHSARYVEEVATDLARLASLLAADDPLVPDLLLADESEAPHAVGDSANPLSGPVSPRSSVIAGFGDAVPLLLTEIDTVPAALAGDAAPAAHALPAPAEQLLTVQSDDAPARAEQPNADETRDGPAGPTQLSLF